MAFSDDSGYYFGESDPSLCETDATPSPAKSVDYPPSPEQNIDATYPFSPEPAVDYCRSPEYIAKSDGNNSDADLEETPVSRPKRAASRQPKSAAAAKGRKSTSSKRSFPPRAKRLRCNRVWREEDEVKILKEMAKSKKSGKEPIADLELFYQVRRLVNSYYTRAQLTDKVRRLKSKYVKIKETARREGEDPIFPTTHDERLYDLSKEVWGGEDKDSPGNGRVKPSANGNNNNGGDDEVRNKLVQFCLKYNGSLSEDVLRDGVSSMGSGRVEVLDILYKQVRTKEMEVEMMKAGLLREVLEEVCDAIR